MRLLTILRREGVEYETTSDDGYEKRLDRLTSGFP